MELNKFVATKARPLPVIIMADTSGSMGVEGKIEALDNALRDMIDSFSDEGRMRAEINLSVITFGGVAKIHLNMTPAHKVQHVGPLTAGGRTPLGDACELVKGIIEDKEIIPSRAYKPVIILASDGYPTDNYEQAFNNLINSERANKATRLALSIGTDADDDLLSSFCNDLEAPLFYAKNASEIARFFRAVTMSVSNQSKSQTPNKPIKLDYINEDLGDDDLDIPL